MASVEEAFRRLTIGDPEFVAAVGGRRSRAVAARAAPRHCAPRRCCASRPSSRVDAPSSSYRAAVAAAQIAGARLEDIFAVLVAIADDVGSARIISAAPRVALAAGYDVEADLE